ncbi:MAG: hypothetical protein GC187_06280 [Alphaproteobacteria bacterium]|nr:hypothetical protein [Alphaproteobacteria bacterium]
MISLESFVTAVKSAVHQAAHMAREQNLQMVYRFFEVREPRAPQPPPAPPPPGPARPQDGLPLAARKSRSAGAAGGGAGGEPPAVPPSDPEGPPLLTPRMVAFEYPVDTPDGPAVHTTYAPLISLVGMQALEIAEFRMVLKVHLADDGKSVSIAFPGAPQTGAAARGRRSRPDGETAPALSDTEAGTIEIVLRSVDPPSGFYEIIRGYDRALRANIPG